MRSQLKEDVTHVVLYLEKFQLYNKKLHIPCYCMGNTSNAACIAIVLLLMPLIIASTTARHQCEYLLLAIVCGCTCTNACGYHL